MLARLLHRLIKLMMELKLSTAQFRFRYQMWRKFNSSGLIEPTGNTALIFSSITSTLPNRSI
jgi:hypothetical protein